MTASHADIAEISPRELSVLMAGDNPPCVLDVRESWELEIARLDGTLDIPMTQVPTQLESLNTCQGDGILVVMCRSGGRSAVIAQYLQQNGFQRVLNLEGGILAWSEQVDQDLPTY